MDVNRSDAAFDWSVQLKDKAAIYSMFFTLSSKEQSQPENAFFWGKCAAIVGCWIVVPEWLRAERQRLMNTWEPNWMLEKMWTKLYAGKVSSDGQIEYKIAWIVGTVSVSWDLSNIKKDGAKKKAK